MFQLLKKKKNNYDASKTVIAMAFERGIPKGDALPQAKIFT